MSVYKNPRSPYWQFDFQHRGSRFHGSTGATSRRAAEAVERAEKDKAKARAAEAAGTAASLRLDDVAGRYWLEIGQHHAGEGAANTRRQLARLIEFFGKDKLITEITGDDIARLVAWRRGHRSRGSLISPFTVNDTTEQVKKLFTRAKVWGVKFAREPRWRDHWLAEPQERVNELKGDQGERLEAAARDEYAPILALAEATGLRQRECLLRWSEVDWDSERIVKKGKGGRTVVAQITSEVRAILWPLRGQHPEFVFTYVAAAHPRRARQGRAPSDNPVGLEDAVAAFAQAGRGDGFSVPRLSARFRHQASAPDRQPQARLARPQSRRPEIDGALRPCRRRGYPRRARAKGG